MDPTSLYENLQLHHRICEVSKLLFKDGHYREAIFASFKEIAIIVKDRSGRTDLDGQDLMAQVFSEKNPVIALNSLKNQSDIDEQKGFRLIYMGAMIGIRNPEAHERMPQPDAISALKYLSLASLLAERAEEASVTQELESVIDSIRTGDLTKTKKIIAELKFGKLEQLFSEVLDEVALLNYNELKTNENLFEFMKMAIQHRDKPDGVQLFQNLLDWFFGTATPYCRHLVLQVFSELTKLSYLKKVVSKAGRIGSFIAEFGSSNSYEIAGTNTEILFNLCSLFSNTDLEKVVDFALSNDQIHCSWKGRRYLNKILASYESRIDKLKAEELRRKLEG